MESGRDTLWFWAWLTVGLVWFIIWFVMLLIATDEQREAERRYREEAGREERLRREAEAENGD